MREAQDLGVNELARLAGVNAGYLSQVEQEKKTPSKRWLRAVTDALGKHLAERAA
jgi:transcriptional regulator with XRE-family HTH domain